jgi:histidinol-phosphate aminotransferase
MLDRIIEQRDLITVELGAMGLKAWPSKANFVLFEVDDAGGVWHRLLERGILVRNYEGHADLEDCLRVTAGTPEETEAFLNAMREIGADEDG